MKSAIALGTFDGLHEGHRAVLSAVLPYNSVAVTFRTPPKQIISGNHDLIMTPKDKCNALKQFGIKHTHLADFEKIRHLTAIEFLDMLNEKYHPVLISCGYNYRFGKDAAGDTSFLRDYCAQHGIEFNCSECVYNGEEPLNSTKIRSLLKEGKIEEANRQIYGGFGFSAAVLHGDERGRTIGFPTINQRYPKALVPVRFGVYAVKVHTADSVYDGIANIGMRPTWRTKDITSETYIKNFSGDLYDKTVTIKIQHFLRPEKRFGSLEELRLAIQNDISCLNNL